MATDPSSGSVLQAASMSSFLSVASVGEGIPSALAIVGILWLGVQLIFVIATTVVGILAKRSIPTINSFKGKRVLITGGSVGIGLSVAKELTCRGANVIITARREDVLRKAVAEIEAEVLKSKSKNDGQCYYKTMDVVMSEVDMHNSMQQVVAEFKRMEMRNVVVEDVMNDDAIDIVVNCAGFSYPSRFLDCSVDMSRRQMDVNYFGSVNICRAVLPAMLKRGGKRDPNQSPKDKRLHRLYPESPCRVVMVASIASYAPVAGLSHYAPTKAALVALAHSLDMECSAYNVRFQVVQPPDVDTPGYEEEMKVKSEECRRICAMGGSTPFSSRDMGNAIVDGIRDGSHFQVTLGLDGWLLARMSGVMQPIFSVLPFLAEVMLLPILRFSSVIYSRAHYGIVAEVATEEASK